VPEKKSERYKRSGGEVWQGAARIMIL
jgi:hypothetical protein